MKSLITSAFLILLSSTPSYATVVQNKLTQCNVYYNNRGRVYEGVPCRVWFTSSGRLYRANVFLPNGNRWYDWDSSVHNEVTQDNRWRECIRHTGKVGNQYQICSVKSPEQFGF
jgi:hypothetical protein